jgi:hypothetical protein
MLSVLLILGCSSWKTIDDPKWGFRIDVPATLQDKQFEQKNLWIHENSELRVIIDFGETPSPIELSRIENYKQTEMSVNGYKAISGTYNSRKQRLPNVAFLIFQEGPESYGSGKPPVFRVEYGSDDNSETAMKILKTVRFYDPAVR